MQQKETHKEIMGKVLNSAIYTRVSTQEQISGYSLIEQAEKLKKYAEGMGYTIVDVYEDGGESGASLLRPALQKLLSDVEDGKIDIILIYKLDRLSRKVKDVLDLVDKLEKRHVALFSLNENIDLSSPFGRAALKMSATFSELERDTITERMTMGRMARIKSGKYICPGHPPFGFKYDKETRTLIRDEQETEVVKRMFDLYCAGWSFRKTHLRVKEEFPNIKYLENNEMCVKAVILRPLYAGYFLYCGELYAATNIEPCISYETWLRANQMRALKRTERVHMDSPHILTGLIRCGRCGLAYVAKNSTSLQAGKSYSYFRYGCSKRLKFDPISHDQKCDNDIYRAEVLEQIVRDRIKNLVFSDFRNPEEESGTVDLLMLENANLKKKKDVLLDLFLEGNIAKEAFTSRCDKIDAQIEKNNIVINTETDKPKRDPSQTIAYLKDQIERYDELPIPEKRRLLMSLIKQIVINGDNIEFEFKVR